MGLLNIVFIFSVFAELSSTWVVVGLRLVGAGVVVLCSQLWSLQGWLSPGLLSKQAVNNCGCVTGIVPAHVAVLEHHKLGEK